MGKNEGVQQNSIRLASRATAVLFDPQTDLLSEVCGFGQQMRSCFRVTSQDEWENLEKNVKQSLSNEVSSRQNM